MIRIKSDGTPVGTSVTDAYTGKGIPNVQAVDIRLSCKEIPRATLHVTLPDVTVAAKIENVVTTWNGKDYLLVPVEGD